MVLAASADGQEDETSKGIGLYRAGNYAEAITVLQKLVDADPKNTTAWTYLGGSLANTGKTKEAIAAFKKSFDGPKSDEKFDRELKITAKPRVPYTDEARSNSVSGTVELMVEFKADGKIGFVVPIRKLMFGLTENSINAAKEIRFDPAIKDDKPVSVIRMMSYSFSIR